LVEWLLNHHAGSGQVEIVLEVWNQGTDLVSQLSDLCDLPLLVIGHPLADSPPE
jgi:hypothetical protein